MMLKSRGMDKIKQAIRDVQHFGEEGGVVPVIDVASTSTFLNPKDMGRTFKGELEGCYLYSRHSNPSVTSFGMKLAAMEGMEAGLGVASGMAAIASAVEQLLPDGGHIVSSRTVYGGTYALFTNLLPKRGIRTTFVDPNDVGAFERAIRPDTKLLYTETISNPILSVCDLEALSALARARALKLVVDNTFAPLLITPARFGADVVIHSCTKYISGASDLIAGAIIGDKSFIQSLVDVNTGVVMLMGPVMDPRVAHELYMRLDHLALRMAAHAAAAAKLASRLESEKIPVIYPGLAAYRHRALMQKMINPGYGFGGMLTVDCGSSERAIALATALQNAKFGLYAVSLGFSRTLMSIPSNSTSSEIPESEQKAMGLAPGLLRLSVGYTGDDEEMIARFLRCWREISATAGLDDALRT
jgi:methionine-gamma-lyase